MGLIYRFNYQETDNHQKYDNIHLTEKHLRMANKLKLDRCFQ